MGKWYDKMFVGNPDKKDFTAKDLPKDRLEQFFDVVKLRFSGMLIGNIIYGLFAIPLLVWFTFYWFSLAQQNDSQAAQALVFGENGTLLTFLLICIPLYTIMGPAKAGLHYCLRNWCWNERATIRDHFWKEFKRSCLKSMFLNFFSAALLYAGCFWIDLLITNSQNHPWLKIVAVILAVLLAAYYMSSIYHFPQLVTYNLKLRQIFKNSFIYMIVQFPRTLAAILIYALLAVLVYYLQALLLVVFLSMGMSFIFLGQTVLSQYLFDKYVNAPEDRRRGMAPLE